jgi:mRNA interferase MazF
MASYVPRKGDLVELSFRPDHGHEQHGPRPALVVSNDLFQRATGLCVVCPVTRTDRGIRSTSRSHRGPVSRAS